MDDMMLSLKLQVYTNLCMSNIEFDNPDEFMEILTKSMTYIVADTSLDPSSKENTPSLHSIN